MVILGLDPGSLHTGYGLVERSGSRLVVLGHGRFSCPKTQSVPERLATLCARLDQLLDQVTPALVGVEAPFFGVNARSLVMLAQARGALLARLATRRLPIVEYSPAEVKSTVTGSGRADKTQVARMVGLLLGFGTGKLPPDATDALAIAVTAAQRFRFDQRVKGLGD